MTTTTDRQHDESAAIEDTAPRKVFAPAGAPVAVWFGALLGVAMLGLCAGAIRDLIIEAKWVNDREWTQAAADWITRIHWYQWMWAVAVGLILVGLLFVWLALKPRKRTFVSLGDYEVMWTRRGDVARRCSVAVATLPGVEHATTVVGRRTAKVTVTTSDGAADRDAVRSAAQGVVQVLARKTRVKVRMNSRSGGRR